MRASELSAELRRLHHGAAAGEMVTNIHPIGIRFADHLSGQALRDLRLEADAPVSCVAEIHKGIRLAPHVMARS